MQIRGRKKKQLFESNCEIEPKKTRLRSKSKSRQEIKTMQESANRANNEFSKKYHNLYLQSKQTDEDYKSKKEGKFNALKFDLEEKQKRLERDKNPKRIKLLSNFKSEIEKYLISSRLKVNQQDIRASQDIDVKNYVQSILLEKERESLLRSKFEEKQKVVEFVDDDDDELNNFMSNPHYRQDLASLESDKLQDIYLKQSKTPAVETVTNNNSSCKEESKVESNKLFTRKSDLRNSNSNHEESYKAEEYRVSEVDTESVAVDKEKSKVSFYDVLVQNKMVVSKPHKNNFNNLLSDLDNDYKEETAKELRVKKAEKLGPMELFDAIKSKGSPEKKRDDKEDVLMSILNEFSRDNSPDNKKESRHYSPQIDNDNDHLKNIKVSKHGNSFNRIKDIEISKRMFNNESSIKDYDDFGESIVNNKKIKSMLRDSDLIKVESQQKLSVHKVTINSSKIKNEKKKKLMELKINNCKVPVFNKDDIDTIVQRFIEKRKMKVTEEKYERIAEIITTTVNKHIRKFEKHYNKKQQVLSKSKSPFRKKQKVTKESYFKKKGVALKKSKSPIREQKYGNLYKKKIEQEKSANKLSKTSHPKKIKPVKKQISKSIIENSRKQKNDGLFGKKRKKKHDRYGFDKDRFGSDKEEESFDVHNDSYFKDPLIEGERKINNRYESNQKKKKITIEIKEKDCPYDFAEKIITDYDQDFEAFDFLVEKLKKIKMNKFGHV